MTAALLDSNTLRDQLMARDPMQRFHALHAIELELEHAAAPTQARLAGEVEKFAARGVPFYAPNDAHYRAWVGRAVAYWEKLHGAPAVAGLASAG
jgi:hypothetical protein